MTISRMNLASGGPEVSRLALGLWRLASWGLSSEELVSLIRHALGQGLTTFDHADIYGGYACEELFGRALASSPKLRDQMQIVTKCGIKVVAARRPDHATKHYDTSGKHIEEAVNNSLAMLRTDRIDLLLIHRPDPLLDADEVASAFSALRVAGKVLHFGVSNFAPFQFELLASKLDFPLVTNQVELSVIEMEVLHDGTVDQCQRLGISPMAWSPLGGGRLFHDETEQMVRLRSTMETIGQEIGGAELDQVALAWILAHPARIVPVLGTGRIDRISSAVKAEALELSREQWFRIWTASQGRAVP